MKNDWEVMTAMILVIILLGIAIWSIKKDKPEYVSATIYVESGDTLWDIAKEYCPDGMDVREYVYTLKQANNTPDSVIQAGEVLTVYVEVSE